MANFNLISVNEHDAWKSAIERCGRHDSYHKPSYHQVARQQGEGEPFLFTFECNGHHAALPFLLRPVADVQGLNGNDCFDATSAYGYPGLLTSVTKTDQKANDFRDKFTIALSGVLKDQNVVTLFVRQNPLIDSSWILEPLGSVNDAGHTVAIDLTLPADQLFANFRKGHRSDIRKGQQQGIKIFDDLSFKRVDEFIQLYNETMNNVGAAGHYYFTKDYFLSLKEYLGSSVKLFLAEMDGQIAGGAIFMATDHIVQYHLSGRASKFRSLRGVTQMLIDAARIWGAENGFSWLHLGGGLGARKDSLFEFKSGFSDRSFSFQTARAVLSTRIYEELAHQHSQWIDQNGLEVLDADYFPKYRSSLVPRAA